MRFDNEIVPMLEEGNRRLPLIGPPLTLMILAVIGSAIVTKAGVTQHAPSTLVIALGQMLSAAIWVGAVWLGGILVYRSIVAARG
jgi:hypothetical protein